MPHNWKEETSLHPHVHWIPKANGGADKKVSWGFEYTWFDIGEVLGNTTIDYADDTEEGDSVLLANKHYETDFSAIDGTGHTISSMLSCRIFRDATGAGGTDDYDDDAGLLEMDFHYEIDTIGSRREHVK